MKILNTIKHLDNLLFSKNKENLKKSFEYINKNFDEETTKNITSYCAQQNDELKKDYKITGKPQNIEISQEAIEQQFYKFENLDNFFGFPNKEEFDEALKESDKLKTDDKTLLPTIIDLKNDLVQAEANAKKDYNLIKNSNNQSKIQNNDVKKKDILKKDILNELEFCKKSAEDRAEEIQKLERISKDLADNSKKLTEEKQKYETEKLDSKIKRLKELHELTEKTNAIENLKNQLIEFNQNINARTSRYEKKPKTDAEKLSDVKKINKIKAELQKPNIQKLLRVEMHKAALNDYQRAFHLSKLIADYVEKNNNGNDDLAHKHAYDMTIMFSQLEARDRQLKPLDIIGQYLKFVQTHGFDKKPQPVHDSFSTFTIPVIKKDVSLQHWQKLFFKSGVQAMKLFSIADQIEKEKAKILKQDGHIAPNDLKEAQEIKSRISYKNAEKNFKIAEIFDQYNMPETLFDKAITEIEPRKKTKDNLPNITIDGSKIGHNGYYFTKLPIDDPRAYVLSKITNCCQSIGGHSEKCVVDGVTRENNGFYVLLRSNTATKEDIENLYKGTINYDKFAIAGQAYAWVSKAGNITFDSWENLRNAQLIEGKTDLRDDAVSVKFLSSFAELATKSHDIDMVTIGIGGKTPRFYQTYDQISMDSGSMLEGYNYGDAMTQTLIAEKPELTVFRNLLNSKLPTTTQICSLEQAQKLHNIIAELERDGKNLLEMFAGKKELFNLLTSYKVFHTIDPLTADYLVPYSELNAEKLNKTISYSTLIRLLIENKEALLSLQDLDVDRIEAMTSNNYTHNPVAVLKSNKDAWDSLKKLDVDKINFLTSNAGRILLEKNKAVWLGVASFDAKFYGEVKNLDMNTIVTIVEAKLCCTNGQDPQKSSSTMQNADNRQNTITRY